MSIKAMTWAWGQEVEARTKLVLMALADHADDDGMCWPGLKGVARKNRISHRAVQRHLTILEQAGLITITPQFRPDGSQTANLYTLTMTVASPTHANNTQEDVAIDTAPPRHGRHGGDDTGYGGGMTRATPLEPPLEPSLEPHPPFIPPKGGKSKRGKHEITEDETAEVLALFQGRSLDIPIEMAGWRAWCQEHGQMATKRRLIAWLNRAGGQDGKFGGPLQAGGGRRQAAAGVPAGDFNSDPW